MTSVLVVLFSCSTVLYSFAGVFWNSNNQNNLRWAQILKNHSISSFTTAPFLQMASGLQACDAVTSLFPSTLLLYRRSLERRGILANLQKLKCETYFKTKWLSWLLPFCSNPRSIFYYVKVCQLWVIVQLPSNRHAKSV